MRRLVHPSFETETGDFADIAVAAANGALFSAFTDAIPATKTVNAAMMQRKLMAWLLPARNG